MSDETLTVNANCLHCIVTAVVQKFHDMTPDDRAEPAAIVGALLQVIAQVVESESPEEREGLRELIPDALAGHFKEARAEFDARKAGEGRQH